MTNAGTIGKICCHQGDVEFDWRIENFSSLSETVGTYYHSPSFSFCHRSWYLRLYPKGANGRSEEVIELYLNASRSNLPLKIKFSLGIKDANGVTDVWGNYKKNFDKGCYGLGSAKCILRSELLRRKDELVPRDVLILTVTLKIGKDQALTEGMKDVSVQTGVEKTIAEDNKGDLSQKTGSEKILQDVRMLWTSGDNSDVKIRVRDVEFKAHKTILAARTPVLGAMFQHDTTEKESGEVVIDDCEPEVFEQILHYIYTGAPQVLTAENASALYVVADKYLMNEVKALCLRCMQDTLCLDTFCKTVTLSLIYREHELLETTIDFLSKNAIDVMKTVEWQMFLREHSTRANELLIRALELDARREKKERVDVDPSYA